ncbi:hypothetical protein GCM10011390_45130 [Aureimonas endophytica]|uniref:Uncharacterized protein n=1 Tax=Aureimonas endophytica TaxID=2027858 RepID=A0A917ECI0_9HYPH|nr:hypothetical protein GCM10011390_45130 [Aureimonas endophytica]
MQFHAAAEQAQHLVAAGMAVPVVDRLEVIEVEQDEAAGRQAERRRLGEEGAAIVDPRQEVGLRGGGEPPFHRLAGERDEEEGADGAEQDALEHHHDDGHVAHDALVDHALAEQRDETEGVEEAVHKKGDRQLALGPHPVRPAPEVAADREGIKAEGHGEEDAALVIGGRERQVLPAQEPERQPAKGRQVEHDARRPAEMDAATHHHQGIAEHHA